MALRLSQTGKRPISERISIFEKSVTSSTSTSSPNTPEQSVQNSNSVTRVTKTVSRTFSGKNFDAIKHQFDSGSAGQKKANTPVTSPTLQSSSPPRPPSTSPPPTPPPRNDKSINIDKSPVVAPPTVKSSPFRQPVTRITNKKSPTNTPNKRPSTPSSSGRPPSRGSTSSPVQKTSPSRQNSSKSMTTSSTVSPTKTNVTSKTITNKSQTAPIKPNVGSNKGPTKTHSPVRNINSVTIDVKPLDEADLAAKMGSASKNSTTVTRVIKDKSSTAPIIVNIEPPTPKTSVTDFVDENHLKTNNNKNNNNKSNSINKPLIEKSPIRNGQDTNNDTRTSYWTNQALLNENSQKMKEAMKLDLEYKEEKLNSLNKELQELSSGGTASDEEVASLKRQKNDLENRLKDQEEELDDLAGQVQMLEQAKTKLEMSMAAMKKDHRRELSSKEDELEDARAANMKKIKSLEQQLEAEHEERLHFVREKADLETKIMNLQEMASRSADEDQVIKLRKDLKRTKALLKDAQTMVERSRNESSNKVVLRQLKNQLEDAEFARTAAIKAKQNAEMELTDVQTQLDDVIRNKNDIEDKLFRIGRERADIATQLEDNEEELSDVMKKYKASVAQLSVDQITITEQANTITDLEEERNKLKENLAEFAQKIQSLEGDNVSTAQHHRLEMKIKELETKLELEQTTRGRMETQINRLKEGIEKLNRDSDQLRVKEQSAQELVRKLQRQLRDTKEDYANLIQKETETNAKKNELEKQLELSEAETVTAKSDLKLAMKRIEDLQTAINGELDSESDSLNSDVDSDSSDDDVGSFLDHRRLPSGQSSVGSSSYLTKRPLESMAEEDDAETDESVFLSQKQTLQGVGEDQESQA